MERQAQDLRPRSPRLTARPVYITLAPDGQTRRGTLRPAPRDDVQGEDGPGRPRPPPRGGPRKRRNQWRDRQERRSEGFALSSFPRREDRADHRGAQDGGGTR